MELTFLQGETENNPLNIQCAGWLDMQQREQSPVGAGWSAAGWGQCCCPPGVVREGLPDKVT